ncbi:spore coat protein [Halobacillus shinanisalinarum]|uniref:Spore coat protein n=1 Tax=Halobacillus shinanisalinarum TaxID=2932258 RepID=A0ABY4H0U4_9BACI|nr:spore coat protein [Halobacillus shinanisalinarum]UOQ93983.1 spore coat protein [Halobacillus shinanisalinarum]
MTLPATDLGLMAEHLSTHEGMLNKLKYYHTEVTNTELKQIIDLQIEVMRTHVKVMLMLINPYQNEYVEVPPLEFYTGNQYRREEAWGRNTLNNKSIALEARAGAKSMADNNFVSALMMKDPNVRHAHIEMALQQAAFQERYGELIKRMGWAFVPHVSVQDQINTYQHFQHILNK